MHFCLLCFGDSYSIAPHRARARGLPYIYPTNSHSHYEGIQYNINCIPMGPPFRFSAKYGLFTYAQCADLDPFGVVDHFASLRAECIVGRESHADGGIHLHAFAMWERRFETTSARKFDVSGCHPNIQAGYGTPEKGWDYATKDGDVVGGGLERPSGNSMDKSSSKWSEIVLAESAEDFWRLCREMDPRSLCCNFTSLQKFVEWNYRTDPAEYANPAGIQYDLSRSPRLDDWRRVNLDVHLEGKLISQCPPGGRVGPLGTGGLVPRLIPRPSRPFCTGDANTRRQTKISLPIWRHKIGKDIMGQISRKTCLLRRTILPGRIS